MILKKMLKPEEIIQIIFEVTDQDAEKITLNPETSLVGPDSLIDSMGLVQLCLALEENGSDLGFDFDWTSEKALSTTNSFFRTIRTLAEEFNNQFETSRN